MGHVEASQNLAKLPGSPFLLHLSSLTLVRATPSHPIQSSMVCQDLLCDVPGSTAKNHHHAHEPAQALTLHKKPPPPSIQQWVGRDQWITSRDLVEHQVHMDPTFFCKLPGKDFK